MNRSRSLKNLSFTKKMLHLISLKDFLLIVFLVGIFPSHPRSHDFRTERTGLQLSFHATSPVYSVLEDEHTNFFALATEKSPFSHSKKIQLQLEADAKSRLFSIFQNKESVVTPKGPASGRSKIVLPPSRFSLAEMANGDLYHYTFKNKGDRKVQITSVSLKSLPVNRDRNSVVAQPFPNKVNSNFNSMHKPVRSQQRLSERASDRSTEGSGGRIIERNIKRSIAGTNPYPIPKTNLSSDQSKYLESEGGRPPFSQASSVSEEKIITPVSGNVADFPHAIKGNLQFDDGFGYGDFAGGTHIVVFREYMGQPLELGRVDLDKGEYELYANQATGRIVAELRTASGQVKGRGYASLERVKDLPLHEKTLTKVNVFMKDITGGLTGSAWDANTFGSKKVPLQDAVVSMMGHDYAIKTVQDGQFLDKQYGSQSLFLLQSFKRGYVSTLAYAKESDASSIQMFPEEYIASLYSYLEIKAGPQQGGVVWGTIEIDGRPTSGAAIENINDSKHRAVYLNSLGLPDSTLEKTSSNGQFIMVDVPTGLTAVRAIFADAKSEIKVLPVDQKTVTQIHVEITKTLKTQITIYDGSDYKKKKNAEVRILGSASFEKNEKKSEHTIQFSKGIDPLFIEIDTDEKDIPATLTLARAEERYSVPTIPHTWINELKKKLNIKDIQQRGIIVGFIDGASTYQVELDEVGMPQSENLLYFDSRGELVPSLTAGVPGGGFVVLNAEEGIRTVLIRDMTNGVHYSQILYVEQNTAALLLKKLD